MKALVVLALLLSGQALADDAPKAPPSDPAREIEGLLVGDHYRYDRLALPLRVAADLLAIPASVTRWEPIDWGLFAAVAAPTLGLMMPFEHPNDARIQRWIRAELGPNKLVWTPLGDAIVWTSLWGTAGGFLLYGWLSDVPYYVEQTSLMLEAFSVTQLYHLTLKLMLGREGPNDAEGMGVIHGPPGFFRLFPAGTPSGHVSGVYAMVGTLDAYWGQPWVSVVGHALALVFTTTVVVDNYHFVSDVVWGAGMGYFIGRWVVNHRSTLTRTARATKPFEPSLSVVPTPGGLGIQVLF